MRDSLKKFCGSTKWVEEISKNLPYDSKEKFLEEAERIWFELNEQDWLEAFSHHPKIGDLKTIKEKFTKTESSEQSSVFKSSETTLEELAKYNCEYEKKFGYIFIICASSLSVEEMLSKLKERIKNKPEEEIKIAANEQFKITKLRIEKFYEPDNNTHS